MLFPDHALPVLSAAILPRMVLSREQVSCLVVHQFLCTLAPPVWQDGFQDFHIWYGDEQPHAGAVKAYLTALFVYFERIAAEDRNCSRLTGWNVVYEMSSDAHGLVDDTGSKNMALSEIKVLRLREMNAHPDVFGLSDGAAVVSANKYVGSGRTGTQEEVYIGTSPEACPVVLVTPPLDDRDVMIVTGAEAMVSMLGHGRNARCGEILQSAESAEQQRKLWSTRTMLLMDALELDLADQSLGMPVDLQPGNVERDLTKAYIGFKYRQIASSNSYSPTIFTGLWGCGSFGGNPEIKACIQWCAASLAGCNLTYICSGEEQQIFAGHFEMFVRRVSVLAVTAGGLHRVLLELRPEDLVPRQNFMEKVLDLLILSNSSETTR